ncbi:MAG: NUDIX hydrolase [Phycisphaerae bacterium]|jgi:8-oxo-dGTP pyrophosphatase MutT (NUDIX family)
MHRQPLLDQLHNHRGSDSSEEAARVRMIEFVEANPDCFERSNLSGHITGAAWLVNAANTHALLTHHRKLGLWLQLGGHADGDPDALSVALREAREESGIEQIVPVSRDIFDVDVHPIPAHNGVPPHLHYDVRFLLRVEGEPSLRITEESIELAWLSRPEVPRIVTDGSVLRMHRKWARVESAAGPPATAG